jgi:aminoglycoside 2'-N-acetyltransferase I
MDSPIVEITLVPTAALAVGQIAEIRTHLWDAFSEPGNEMTEADWEHALGGIHVLLSSGGALVGHASVVERTLWIGERPFRTGYVEAVATRPDRQGQGFGTLLMRRVNDHIGERFELGGLGTGVQPFYERLGWLIWRGPTWVRTEHGPVRTPDEDGYIMVLPTPAMPNLELTAPLSCEWRPGDVW